MTVGLVAATAAGRRHARILADAWPHARLVESTGVADALRTAWTECGAVVAFLATGAVVRILAPLLGDKRTDPAVVVVDEAARHAVALLGGHAGGANTLAGEVAALLDARPVVTTATDAVGLPGLDALGWPVEGAVAAVSRAILDGEPVRLLADATWPLPALPPNVLIETIANDAATPTDAATSEIPATPVDPAVPSPPAGADGAAGSGVAGRHRAHGADPDGADPDGADPDGADPDGADPDGGTSDGGTSDGGTSDGGTSDGGTSDGGTSDGGTSDGGTSDGGTSDGGTSDGGTSDGGTSDGGTSDGGTSDGGTSDGGTSDGGTSDVGTSDGGWRLLVTDRIVPLDERTAVLRPPSLVAGIGSSRGVAAAEVSALLHRALADAGLAPASLRCLASVDLKADEEGILATARALGVPLETRPAAELAAVDVPHPSEVVRAVVGTPSVAEAAALAGGGTLLVPKTASAMATVAVARHAPRGRLAVVGLGPGAPDLRTPRAVAELRRAAVVVGLDQYVDQVRDLLRPGTRVLASGLGAEEERARAAVAEATVGQAVALVGSGDAGVYAMASPALEYADGRIDVVGVPGVTAGLAAAALLGAPIGHDHVYLSLSDLHTPWEVIERRVAAAAEADLVALLYNPRSRARDWQLGAVLKTFAAHRPPATPVGVVRNASRDGEQVHLATVATLDPAVVDMYSVVVVGSSQTRVVAGRMVTPRGYRWQR
ncbi:precorrin-3B C(17)-methyltransferase [Micromonospora coxensis]|uniref:Precorrin-3B C17-methyltransferase n=1 Tax=Micromonospora coxensis TaxID=356852 RepID=A0A1C5H963_9ACTN|nr:precorrin-3B C(17)-methyltransferase [Micromonospora coxensis]SCG42483.1 precorrin-3B C17-methyltransferase [Micromonospora coxensis]